MTAMIPAILIAGPSASGKSSLANAVAAALRVPCLSLDDYFIRKPRSFVETPTGPIRTFERPYLYDGARLAKDVLAHPAGVVAEGFCLFNYPEIMALTASRFYLDVAFSVCLARRLARRPRRVSDQSFQIVGEQETNAFVIPQQHLDGVHVLDGIRPLDELLIAVVS